MVFDGNPNSKITCASGAECLLKCPAGTAGSSGCTFDTCANGTAEVCDDEETVACGADCP
jgi:hypothetical protein